MKRLFPILAFLLILSYASGLSISAPAEIPANTNWSFSVGLDAQGSYTKTSVYINDAEVVDYNANLTGTIVSIGYDPFADETFINIEFDDNKSLFVESKTIQGFTTDTSKLFYGAKFITENGFTPEFEEGVLKAELEPIKNDGVWETNTDVDAYFKQIEQEIASEQWLKYILAENTTSHLREYWRNI